MIFPTFFFAFVIDQFAQSIFLVFVYIIVVRRFLYLQSNEMEFSDPSFQVIKTENAIPKLKLFCLKLLESSIFENLSMLLITVYTFFVLFLLTFADALLDDLSLTQLIDTWFLIIFMLEIILKSFASNLMYLIDKFNRFDALIVLISLILNLFGITLQGLAVLRLIRVVVITLRKITGNDSKLRH